MDARYYYLLPNLIAALCMLYLLGLVWRLRERRGGRIFVVLAAGAVIWAGCEAALYLDLDLAVRIRVTQFQYLGICSVPAALFSFVMIHVGRLRRITPAYLAGIYVLPAVILVLAWTNPWHHLLWSRMWTDTTGPFPMLALVHGPAYWVYTAYSYVLLAACTGLLWTHALRSSALFSGQSRFLLAATLLPWVFNLVYISGRSPVPNLDLTAVSFSILALPLGLSFLRYRLLDLIPVARDVVFQELSSAVLVLDAENRVLDLNQAAFRLLGQSAAQAVGRDLTSLLKDEPGLLKAIGRAGREKRTEVCLTGGPAGAFYEVRLTPLRDRRGKDLGRLVVMADISDRKALEDELRRLAATDPLTGLANRRSFMELSRRKIAGCIQGRQPMALLMIDIDHFKRVNDTYGHPQGDRVLKALAQTFRELLRQNDLVGRMGGEEFAVLLPESSLRQAMEVAERLRRSVLSLSGPDSAGLPTFTICVGVAELADNAQDLETLMIQADQALYRAKASGRNACRSYVPAESPGVSAWEWQ